MGVVRRHVDHAAPPGQAADAVQHGDVLVDAPGHADRDVDRALQQGVGRTSADELGEQLQELRFGERAEPEVVDPGQLDGGPQGPPELSRRLAARRPQHEQPVPAGDVVTDACGQLADHLDRRQVGAVEVLEDECDRAGGGRRQHRLHDVLEEAAGAGAIAGRRAVEQRLHQRFGGRETPQGDGHRQVRRSAGAAGAPVQDQRAGGVAPEGLGDERRLARPGSAFDRRQGGATGPRRAGQAVEQGQLVSPSDHDGGQTDRLRRGARLDAHSCSASDRQSARRRSRVGAPTLERGRDAGSAA